AAFRAADLGREVTLVTDEDRLGGVCLLRGCIPSKALLHLAGVRHDARAAADMGLAFGEPDVDLDRIREWKDSVVDRLTSGLDALCKAREVRVVRGRAAFTGARSVRVEGSEADDRLAFDTAVLATGSRPVPFPDAPFEGPVLDSARALELRKVPDRLLVVGGGYVGLEMGTVYAALGSRVTLVEMENRLMPGADADLMEPLAERVEELFDEVRTGTKVTGLEVVDKGVRIGLEGGGDGDGSEDRATGTSRDFDAVLVALGRRPRTDDLGLGEAGIDLDDDGFVVVDEERRTTNEAVFAAGDVTGGMLLAHEGMHEGRVAAEVAAGRPAAFDARAVPAVVYTDPQVAWCGLTEARAREEGREVEVGRFPWKASGRALSMGRPDGFTKLVLDPDEGFVLGVGIVGPHAECLVAEGVLAVEMGARVWDLASIVHPHPTLSETLGEAAERSLGVPLHVAPGGGRGFG
ncbi:MAG TPA: dihydrolipoyl dehydrogenase, partial [Longimicrobiales bacterium]|nr:dihydrolipoyl dehydrogenase [Longimicrobiales bacterium]